MNPTLQQVESHSFLVGGAVRDQLLDIPVRERDWVVVGLDTEVMIAAGFQPVGRDFPVFLHPTTREEYALARTERKSAPGYRGFVIHASPQVTLEEDLRRRDLTINAMALDHAGRLIDPFRGREDLDNGLLRHVSEAYTEDPVRILRTARFAARFGRWGFRVAHTTHHLMEKLVSAGEVDHLVAERVWQETRKALDSAQPQRYFEVLRACGALERIFPELDALFGVPQPAHHHPEIDSGVHTLLVLQQAARLSDKSTVRFAALLHDLGKGMTPADQWPRHHGHEDRGRERVEQLCKRLKVPREYRDLALLVTQFHGHYHRADELRPATLLQLLESLDALRRPERLDDFLLACEADQRGRTGFEEHDFSRQPKIIRAALTAAHTIIPQQVITAGYQGAEISREMHRRRVQAIKQTLPQFLKTT